MTSPKGTPKGPREPVSDAELDARLVGYLRDAPERAPQHLLGAAAVRVHSTRQRGRRGAMFGPMTGWAVVAAAAVIAVLFSLRVGMPPGPGTQASPGATPARITIGSGREPGVTQQTATPTTVRDIVVVDGVPWAVLVDGLAFGLDPDTGAVVTDLDAQLEQPTDVAAGAGSIWVGSGDATLVRIDPVNGTVQARVPTGIAHHAVAANEEAVWVAGSSEARRIDASTLEVADFDLPPGVLELAAVGDAVWATYATGLVVVADGRTGAARASVNAPAGVGGPAGGLLATSGGSLWLAAPGDGRTLARMQPNPAAVTGEVRFDVPGSLSWLVADAQGVWILFGDDGLLVRLDAATLTVTDTIAVGLGARGIGLVPAGLALWGASGVRVLDVGVQ